MRSAGFSPKFVILQRGVAVQLERETVFVCYIIDAVSSWKARGVMHCMVVSAKTRPWAIRNGCHWLCQRNV